CDRGPADLSSSKGTASMSKAWIFDLDGVICHTDEFHYLAWKRLCEDRGLSFDRALNEQLRGVSRKESLEIILRNNKIVITEQEMQMAMEKKNGWYREYLHRLTPGDLEPDVRPVLLRLRSQGRRIAIGSSSKNTHLILGKLGIEDLFDAIVDGTMISKSKPDPEVFLKAAQLLGYPPARCIVVEDALSGIQAALAAGMQAVAFRLHCKDLPQGVLHAEDFTELVEVDDK
ncbi:MAG: beta-phosphoglucomutase, partial [Sphaerochaetaceae bacterium]